VSWLADRNLLVAQALISWVCGGLGSLRGNAHILALLVPLPAEDP
jgi:hypothetical protein